MSILNDSWNKIFNSNSKNKSAALPSRQLKAACEIFGNDISPQCQVDYPALGKQLYEQAKQISGLDQILENMQAIIISLQDEIDELGNSFAEMEREQLEQEAEKDFFSSRIVKALYGNSMTSGAYRMQKTSKKASEGQNSSDWTSNMTSSFTKKQPQPHSNNIYSRHDLRPGKQRGQFKLS